ncbi:MATE family efflux transporter [Vibrio aestuarianus]|uniref:Multidrug resistance protein NorM n=1 Tax=Vibrio aestuarianus TaxID=28171 RepID=A0A9X4IYW2_9VIBR|nr:MULTISPECIES: MATE family efflux transporter [Vibrio]MDE1221711.1 MATE family efflux transporter [Vibrio aestuarianus]MDE1236356.1 MATE family efflux transporter [Vibrio aestuarianus]MDE1247234.1 MATE family efflux transporter [Vibrio aestuarianus]MDE1264737.1 MATE family efflux transporter [Vibrio aestuarianus]MDE1296723.1 MATE family efflux transporter [Vibrio aestuarianus]
MHRYKLEASNLIKLASPVLVASIAQTGMGFVDTVMAGGVSAIDMAAVSIAASIWLPSILFGVGLLMALVPVVAQLNGSGRQKKIPFEIQQGAALALFVSIPIIGVLFQTQWILKLMDVEPLMAEKTNGYMYAVMFAVPSYLLFQTLRSFTDGMSLTKPAMVIGFIGLLVNIPLNWIFVYGKFGIPEMGGVGCGVATAIVYWIMFFMLLLYVMTSKRIAHINIFGEFHKPQWKAQIRLFQLGFPVAAAIFFEVTLFAVVALLVAPLGSLVVAAHQVALNFSSLIFMLPMSIGAAVSIRVGHKLGEKDIEGATIASRVGLLVGLSTAVITATLTVIFREQVALLYTENSAVVAMAMQLLLFAAIYQCTDAIQVVAAGALRGYKDMTAIFNRTFIAYWIIGLPTGYVLAMTDMVVEPMGASGFWIGFIVGLSSAALMLGIRLHWMHKQEDHIQLDFASK